MLRHVVAGSSRYALATQESADLVVDLSKRFKDDFRRARTRTDPVVVVRLEPHDPLSDLARAQEQTVFAHDLGENHTPLLMAREYGPYESESVFYVAFDTEAREIVGASRAIYGTGLEPPKVYDLICDNPGCSARIWDEHGVDLKMDFVRSFHGIAGDDGVLDFATLAVSNSARRWSKARSHAQPSVLLYSAMTRDSYFVRGDAFASGEATEQLLRFLQGLVGLPAVPIAGLPPFAAFEGDEILSAPFIFRWEEWADAHSDGTNPKTKVGRAIYELAAGARSVDPILF